MHPALVKLLETYPTLRPCLPDIEHGYNLLSEAYHAGGKALFCGNGGSAADCEHIVGELMKGYRAPRPLSSQQRQILLDACGKEGNYLADHLQGALPALSLVSHTALITAFANDVAADMIFAQQVFGLGCPGDVLVAISTSGNSANVVHAVQVARAVGLKTIGFTGVNGGKLKALCDVTIRVPADETAEIQEFHLPIYHALCDILEKEFFA